MAALFLSGCSANAQSEHDEILSRLDLPEGFKIDVYAEVPKARSMAYDPDTGYIYVGSRGKNIHVIADTDGDFVADKVHRLADDLNVPNGLAVREGHLYIALNDKIIVWDISQDPFEGEIQNTRVILDDLPSKRSHGWRVAKFGPDDKLYVTLGVPCNICTPDGLEGTLIRLNPDGSDVEIIAKGTRNSVGFDFHPPTGKLFFTDNGADNMGDDIPPDELNRVDETGAHFGFPYFGGNGVSLTGFENKKPDEPVQSPVVNFQAHVAALGLHFYRGEQFPQDYQHDGFVAQHGSWNRTIPVGYQIVRVKIDANGQVESHAPFISGWLDKDESIWGRPVDIIELPDGSMLISDDSEGLIYRVSYTPNAN